MNRIVVLIAVLISFTIGNEPGKLVTGCNVVEKGILMCETYGANRTVVYHFKKDGSVIEKFYQGNPDEYGIKSERRVFTSVVEKIDGWPCLEKRSGGDYKIVSGDCFARAGTFLKKIADGGYLRIVDLNGNTSPISVGWPKNSGTMVCESTTKVTTFGHNKVTGYPSDMKVYENLNPGTYCEDFLATDALYWKP